MHHLAQTTYEGYPAVELSSPEGLVATYAPRVGMVGCSLRHDGDELLTQRGGLARYEATGSTFGIPLLHPWANRLSGFAYEFAGRRVELDPDAPLMRTDPNGLSIHGLAAASPYWVVEETAADEGSARLGALLDFAARPEYLEAFPFAHELASARVRPRPNRHPRPCASAHGSLSRSASEGLVRWNLAVQ